MDAPAGSGTATGLSLIGLRLPGGRVFANSEELLRYLKNEDVKFVDVRFCDLPGVMQHFNLPVE
ncbi:hypothetical protein, partial [Micromonospora sp. BL4]|uniref:hypothetical protein n=1 Tax=Micromonospora sp. BL4 TaxID=2478710 RepID=UPI0011C361BD